MAKNIHNAHDRFFKSVLSDKELAQEFLTHFLPKDVVQLLDVKALEAQDYSYNNAELKAIFSDIIFNVPLKSSSNKFCQVSVLLEHKSSKDPYTAFQLLQYIASGYMKQIENNLPLSPILPVVYYHGKQPWTFQSISDHFDAVPGNIRPYIPDIATHFIDLGLAEKVRNVRDTQNRYEGI